MRHPQRWYWLALALAVEAVADGLPIANPGFEEKLAGWRLQPGTETQIDFEPRAGGLALVLHPDGKLLGVDSDPLAVALDRRYEATVWLRNDGLENGSFAFSAYCFDAAGKALKQLVFYALTPKSKPHDWQRVRGQFGIGSTNPLPAETTTVRLRFSFWARDGDCRGRAAVDDLAVRETPRLPGDVWPAEGVTVETGDLQVRFEPRAFWSLYRIDYRGERLGLDRFGSHYGVVASFPGTGFVGTGHRENEDEQLEWLELRVDGVVTSDPPPRIRCETVELRRRSQLRNLHLETRTRVSENRIYEEATVRADEETKLGLLYVFMHPWTPAMTDYLALTTEGERLAGEFVGDRGFRLEKPTRWSAVFNRATGKGTLTYVLETPAAIDWQTRYWDIDGRYRKHYLMAFQKQPVPANRDCRFRCLVIPFEASPGEWQSKCEALATQVSHSTPTSAR